MLNSIFWPYGTFREQAQSKAHLDALEVQIAGALGPFFSATPGGLMWNVGMPALETGIRRLRVYGEKAINPYIAQARVAYESKDQFWFIHTITALFHYFCHRRHHVGGTLFELARELLRTGHDITELQGQLPAFLTPGYLNRFKHPSHSLGWDWQQIEWLFCTMRNDSSLPEWIGVVPEMLKEFAVYVGVSGDALEAVAAAKAHPAFVSAPPTLIMHGTSFFAASTSSSIPSSSIGISGQSSSNNRAISAASNCTSAALSPIGQSFASSPVARNSVLAGSKPQGLIPSSNPFCPIPPNLSNAAPTGPALTFPSPSLPRSNLPSTVADTAPRSIPSAAPSPRSPAATDSAGGVIAGAPIPDMDVEDVADDPGLEEDVIPGDEEWNGSEANGHVILEAMRENVDTIKAELCCLADTLDNRAGVDIKRVLPALKTTVGLAHKSHSKPWFTIQDVHAVGYFQCIGNMRLILEQSPDAVAMDQKLQTLESQVVALYMKMASGKIKTFYDKHGGKKD